MASEMSDGVGRAENAFPLYSVSVLRTGQLAQPLR